jgi:hypothetical protein
VDYSGERRLPACHVRQLAGHFFNWTIRHLAKSAFGKLPNAAGWQPALPGKYRVDDTEL